MFGERNGNHETPSWPPGAAGRGDVYVVEDDTVLKGVILRVLHGADLTARAYARAADFLAAAPQLPPGCLLTDLSLPGMDGLELIRRIHAAGLPFTAIVVTGHADVRVAVEAMKAGASDIVEKPFSRETLLAAVWRALEARAWVNADRAPPAAWLGSLTAREREVLEAVLDGATNKMIARRLHISPRTVEVYRASLMRKTGSAALSDLVRRALLAGVGGSAGEDDRSGAPWTPPGA